MSKNIKKALCLTLAVAMTGSLFTACGKKESSSNTSSDTLGDLTTDEITLTYQLWEDGPIADSLNEEWAKLHPNITVNVSEVPIGDNNSNLSSYLGSDDMPDVFWVLGTPDFAITQGMLRNMEGFWSADPDTQNVIGGIDEFKLGYLGTEGKWTTPVKFFPTEAWLNMNYFNKNNTEMPSTDWTFEEMEDIIEALSPGDGTGWGVSESVTVITWYPIASDPDCIGEFGWNGKEFDLTNWAEGMEIEKSWIDNDYKAPAVIDGTEDQYPQDLGMVAMRLDNWWCWERYWDKDEMYTKNVYWVPYVLPHTEENSDSDTYLATMDFGGIYSETDYPREAYEVLKFFCWGAEGWTYKLSKYDEIVALGSDASVSGLVPGPINNCPITTDETIWKEFEKKHPTTEAGGDTVGIETYGVDRAKYFDDFFEKVRTSTWTCYGSGQIPGFDTWLANTYNSATLYDGASGVEDWVLNYGGDPTDKVKSLTDAANETNQEFIDQIAAILE
jgi:multiple sugar transport system substrate-binding protein